MPKALINGISMYYEIHGKGEPLVFIAGFSADHAIWTGILNQFKDKYQIILFDNRGAGQTDAPQGPYSIEQMTTDTSALCSHLGIQQAHFVGSSMGGYILQMLTYQHKELVKSATICNSSYATHTTFHYYVAAQLELIKAQAPAASISKASCCWAFSYQFLSKPSMLETLIRLNLNNPYPFTISGYEGQYAALSKFDSRPWLDKIDVPTLIIGSEQDLIFNEASMRILAERIPNAQYYCFNECGHLPFIEYPQQFVEVVSDFIGNI